MAAQQLDHIVRIADGGSDDRENLQMLCACCHSMKSAAEQGAATIGRTTKQQPAGGAPSSTELPGPIGEEREQTEEWKELFDDLMGDVMGMHECCGPVEEE